MASEFHTSRENKDPLPPRRLKGLLALLPETVSWYPCLAMSHCDPLVSSHEICSFSTNSIYTKKITSRKQQRRYLKRCQNALGNADVEQGNSIQDHFVKKNISLADHVTEMDVVVLFMFDPYQPYSLHLLQKLISVNQLPDTAASSALSSVPLNSNDNALSGSQIGSNEMNSESTATSVSSNSIVTNEAEIEGISPIQQETMRQPYPKLHCIVVTPCNNMEIIDRLLENSGTLLIPWSSDHSAWRMATASYVCPSIVGIYECRLGRNLFTAQQEELALDWNTPFHVRKVWLYDRKSALSLTQRIQGVALHPTASTCIVQ